MERGRELEKIGSVGRALSQVDIEIRDDEGRPLACGEEGEVCIRGAKVTQGYWQAPEKTAASFFGEWLRTGDVGYLDSQGFLFITDRKKDMIISGGENIASSEVERAILELPQVRDAAVVGAPDARWGERPIGFIALHPGPKPFGSRSPVSLPQAAGGVQGSGPGDLRERPSPQRLGQGAQARTAQVPREQDTC
jgi:fatty-acyl-CoA synthase